MKYLQQFLKRILSHLALALFLMPIVVKAQPTDIAPIQSIAWSPDGEHIAVALGSYISEDHDYAIRILDANTGEIIDTLDFHSGGVASVDWSPDSTRLVSSGEGDAAGLVWDISTGQRITLSQPYSMAGRFADIWNPDGNRIANTSGGSSSLNIWNPNNGQTLSSFHDVDSGIPHSVDWSPDASQLVTGNENGTITIWDVSTGEALLTLQGHMGIVTSVSWSPDGSQIASGGWDDTIRIWNIETGTVLYEFTGHSDNIAKVVWSPDGSQIASASRDGTIRVWNVCTGEGTTVYHASSPMYAVEWSPDSNQIAFGGVRQTAETLLHIVPTPPIDIHTCFAEET